MRNLEVRSYQRSVLNVEEVSKETCWLYCTDTQTHFILNDCKLFKLSSDFESELIADLGAEGLMDQQTGCVGIVSLSDSHSVLLGLQSGLLLEVDVTSFGEVEEVGHVECGLERLAISPDLEIITLVTREMVVVTMTRDYSPVKETSLVESQFGAGEMMNVGWGSKETQFHGSEGKQARVVKAERGELMDGDDREVRVSWRGDGEMFCVSFVMAGGESGAADRRKLRVLDRRGGLYSVTQEMVGLQWTMAWRPSGSLIAAPLTRNNKQSIAFFEKNCLQHGGFDIPSELRVRGLEWSPDSDLLALTTDSHLLLYTVGNYHWYLKQQLSLGQGWEVVSLVWSEDSEVVRCLVRSGERLELRSWRLGWVTSTSQGLSSSDLSVVAVVDGRKVLVTPFRQVTVPPPSSAYQVEADSEVRQVVFSSPAESPSHSPPDSHLSAAATDSNSFLIVTRDGNVLVMRISTGEEEQSRLNVTGAGGGGYHVKCSTHSCVATLSPPEITDACNVVWVGQFLVFSHWRTVKVVTATDLVQTLHTEEEIYSLSACPGGVLVQLSSGRLQRLSLSSLALEDAGVEWPAVCPRVISTQAGSLGLTGRYRLFLDSSEIHSGVTSIFLHSDFLLATTLDHRLITLPLHDLQPKVSWEAAASRRVERGSRLVCSVAKHSRTVLQMPRGNLEVIQPRSLSILLVAGLLDKGQYLDAFLLARTHRMNLNLLVDHNREAFLASCDQFVAQINNNDHLNIFLADLLDEDVCCTMYSSQYHDRKPLQKSDKVKTVCDRVRSVLQEQDDSGDNKRLLPILATLVRDGGQLEAALKKIKIVKDGGQKKLVDDGIRFLAYMVDVNTLFDVALGTYDFDIVMMVAEKSQKDPKEYLPFLNNFKKMEENFRKYSIDKHLKRYESALENIVKCAEQFPLCLELVTSQRLYKAALQLLPRAGPEYRQVCRAYGGYLSSKRYHEEASLLYQRSGNLDEAVSEARLGLCWERAGQLARAAGWPQERLTELYLDLVTKLEAAGRPGEAATILAEWCQDGEEAVALLARCHQWRHLLRLVWDLKRDDLIQTHVRPALVLRRDTLEESIGINRHQLDHYVERLGKVRTYRNSKLHNDLEDIVDDDRNVEDADLFSETTSVGGTSTAKSRSTLQTKNTSRSKSSKNRRKQDRKLFSTKEGSLYEDIGLMAAIHELISGVPVLRDEVGLVLRGLAEVGDEEEDVLQSKPMKNLLSSMDNLLERVEVVVPLVWCDVSQEAEQERFGPEHTVEDIVRGGLASQEYKSPVHLLPPNLRFPPIIKQDHYWKLQFL